MKNDFFTIRRLKCQAFPWNPNRRRRSLWSDAGLKTDEKGVLTFAALVVQTEASASPPKTREPQKRGPKNRPPIESLHQDATMWDKERQTAAHAAKEAGAVLIRLFGQVNRIVKKGEIDLVTEADLQAEKTILDAIGRDFPKDRTLAEETGEEGERSDRIWIIDPLDGTTNFAHSFPFFAVSIALEVEKEIVLGLVYNPFMNECFQAVKGGGAFLNDQPIRVSETRRLGDALLATGFPYDIHERPDEVLKFFRRMIASAQGVRRAGAAAIDLCYVAAGRLDGFWEEGLKPWDTAAGMLILSEAGGELRTYEGRPYSPYERTLVASNAFILQPMLETLNRR